MSEYQEEEAKNGTVFRDMNEWTAEANDARSGPDRPIDLYLCSDPLCAEPINLTRPEYEAMRTVPVRVAISLNPEIDELLFENERFATAETFYAVGAEIARATDPRRTGFGIGVGEPTREEVNTHARHVDRDPRDHRSDLGRPDYRLPRSASVSRLAIRSGSSRLNPKPMP
jgi:hypothetical protein